MKGLANLMGLRKGSEKATSPNLVKGTANLLGIRAASGKRGLIEDLKLEVIPADLGDTVQCGHIIRLLDLLAQDACSGGAPLPAKARENIISEFYVRPFIRTFIAYANERCVGLCVVIESFNTFACAPVVTIHNLFVQHDWRSRGIGMLLLRSAATLARNIGACKLQCDVMSRNGVAKGLFSKCGFEPFVIDDSTGSAESWHLNLYEDD